MKLRNKKTGEIVDVNVKTIEYSNFPQVYPKHRVYKSISELNAEWEDYEEPKEYWYYDTTKNGIDKITHLEDKEKDLEIGNYFETKEEAEKAVLKLKAWKRLKDKGCRLILDDHFAVKLVGPDATKITSAEEQKSLSDDYKLLFGGEE